MRAACALCGLLLAVVAVVAGCGEGGSGEAGERVSRIAIATPGGAGDTGWSGQGIAAARRVAQSGRLRLAIAERVGDGDVRGRLERLADGGAQLLIAHGRGYGEAAASAAAGAGVPTLVFGAPELAEEGLVGDVEVATEQGGYLAGYIAARASYVRAVGIVVAADDPAWYRTAGGFIAGARRFEPGVTIRYARVGPAAGDDATASRRAAERLIADGAQMVLGLGDRSTAGVMRAARNALVGRGQPRFDAMFVDVVGDKSGAGHRSITGLTAVRWNFAPAYRQAIADVRAGRFGSRTYTLDLANGGVWLTSTGRTPGDGYDAAMRLGRRISRGDVAVPVTTTDAEVRALLAQGRGG